MENRMDPMPRHARFPVKWPMSYGNEAFLAKGTVLDLTAFGWRLAGTMPVTSGMQLRVQVSVPDRSVPLQVQRATVLWVNGHEFAIEAHELALSDQAWVTDFLREKLRLRWMAGILDQLPLLPASTDPSHGETEAPQRAVPSLAVLLHRYCVAALALTEIPTDVLRNGDAAAQEDQLHDVDTHRSEKMFSETCRTVRGMVALKTARVRTGRSPIPDN